MAMAPKVVQRLKVVSANAAHWAGGIAGNSGTNYSVVIKAPVKYTIQPDSIWIKGEGTMPIKTAAGTDNNEAYITRQAKGNYAITAKTFHSYGIMKEELSTNTLNPENPFGIDAAAVISYKCNGRRYLLPVRVFTQQPQLNLP